MLGEEFLAYIALKFGYCGQPRPFKAFLALKGMAANRFTDQDLSRTRQRRAGEAGLRSLTNHDR
uniref:Uncharacterized protein n=1 Tax=Aquisalinus luteolus TaxID=1566827 RepID=A0A8J3A500_9PROT|nr:hypothetical protein GCM10011355_04490 [Aquisalinus luteolus]